jgi:protein SCO1/2
MKKSKRSILAYSTSLLVAASAGSAANSDATLDPHAHHQSMDAAEATSHSLFNVSSEWQNQNGDTLPLNQLEGKVQVVAMVYTTCQYACPRIVAQLKAIEGELASHTTDQIGICLVTIDPERDTVEAFNRFAKEKSLDTNRWTFLRGSPGDILELANLLGVKYKRLPDGEFSHSNIITLVNGEGEIVHQLNGLGTDPAPLVAEARELLTANAHAHHH